jgi:hypothetical protein
MANPLKIILNKFFPSEIQTQNNNIDTQTFDPNLTHNVSMVSGFDGTHENLAIVDSAGNLHVNSAASSYLHYYGIGFNVSTTYTNTPNIVFPAAVSFIILQLELNAAAISFIDTTTGKMGPVFALNPGVYTFPIVTTAMAIYEWSSGNGVGVNVVAFY